MLNDDLMRHLGRVATRAPSIHNTQPWRLEVREGGLDVRADRSRQLPVIDPLGRQLLMSCGALVHHLVIASRALGQDALVELLPHRDDPDLVAHVRLEASAEPPSEEEIQHCEAILFRATDRHRFLEKPVDDGVFHALWRAVESQGAVLLRAREEDRVVLDVLVDHAEQELLADESYAEELGRWVFDPAVEGERPDGIPVAAVDPGVDRAEAVPGRRFRPAPEPRHDEPPVAEHPDLLLITTQTDEPVDWVRAGMALSALLLAATERGLSAQPIGQVTDIAYERARLRAALGLTGPPQLLLRVGAWAGRPILRTPRRDVDEVLHV